MIATPSPPAHEPVLRRRVVELVSPPLQHSGSVLIDATLGLGGHSEAILKSCPESRVIGIDRDPEAVALAQVRLRDFGDRFVAVHAVYDEIPEVRRIWISERSTRSSSTWVSPRCNSISLSVASRTAWIRRWTCGWIPPRRSPQPTY